jgi:hypothetical protein
MLKVGKLADKGYDVERLVTKAGKIAKNTLSPEETKGLEAVLKLGPKTTTELAEKIAAASGTDKTLLLKGMEALKAIQTSSVPTLGSQNLGLAIKGLSNIPSQLGKALSSKAVMYGTRAAVMAPAIPAIANTAATVYNDGWAYTKPSDIKDIAMGLSVGNT